MRQLNFEFPESRSTLAIKFYKTEQATKRALSKLDAADCAAITVLPSRIQGDPLHQYIIMKEPEGDYDDLTHELTHVVTTIMEETDVVRRLVYHCINKDSFIPILAFKYPEDEFRAYLFTALRTAVIEILTENPVTIPKPVCRLVPIGANRIDKAVECTFTAEVGSLGRWITGMLLQTLYANEFIALSMLTPEALLIYANDINPRIVE